LKKILLVDDSSLLRNNLKKILVSIPTLQLVGEAVDSDSAIKLNNEQKPDIIILDIDLLKGNGIEVLTRIKNEPHLPIIIMFTNYSESAFRKATKKLGADYFFDKSDDINGLIEVLKNLSAS
jgi:DNA-binding NarL/FixJ family response regulator